MFSQFAQNTDWYYIVGQIFRTHCNHTSSCSQTVIFDVCFQEPGESMLTLFSLHSKKKKRLQLPTVITQSHLVPGKQIQALHFPELVSGDVLQKDEMRLMQHRKAQRVCLSRVFKNRGTVSLTLFVFPHFLVRSVTHFHAHPWKPATFSMCTNSNYTHKCTHMHTCAHAQIQTNTTLRVVISITSKHLQCD